MMTIKTTIKESNIHGIGLFADEFIQKGTKIWEFTPNFDLKYTREEINQLPIAVQDYMEMYAWLSKKSGKYCFSSDNGKYFNHSKQNNVQSYYFDEHEEVITYAYGSFEEGFEEKF